MRKFFALMLAGVLAVGLVLGCGTFGSVGPSVVGVPSVIFPALCQAFFDYEDYDSSTPTVVMREARPIYNTFALRVLHEAGAMTPADAEQDRKRDEVLRALMRETRVEVPESGGPCRWLRAERPGEHYYGTDVIVLELSNITENPFATVAESRFGVFARLSIGGASGASWFWVPLQRTGGAWSASQAYELAISDG